MRKRTRKHRGTAGKMVGGFLAFFCLILLMAGMFWAIPFSVFYLMKGFPNIWSITGVKTLKFPCPDS